MSFSEQPVDFGKDFWKIDRRMSGKSVDFFRAQNIPFNSKTIDKTVGLTGVISHKSTDTRLKSYQDSAKVYAMGMRFVRQLAAYQGEIRMDHKIGATYNLQWAIESPYTIRTLEWFIPDSELLPGHTQAFTRVIADAAALRIFVKIFPVLDY